MPSACASPVDDLRARIAALEHGWRPQRPGLPTGVAAVDAHLGGGLAQGALHELAGGGPDATYAAAPALFAAAVLGRARGPVLWVSHRRDVYAPALACFGLHPDRVVYAETGDERAVLPAAEEGLRHRGLAGVVAETATLSLVASRRLQLAAEASGVTLLLIRRWRGRGEPELTGTVATTRWRFTAVASAPLGGVPGLGAARWRVELLRWRGGQPASWLVEADDEAGHLRLAADLADRPHQAAGRFALHG